MYRGYYIDIQVNYINELFSLYHISYLKSTSSLTQSTIAGEKSQKHADNIGIEKASK